MRTLKFLRPNTILWIMLLALLPTRTFAQIDQDRQIAPASVLFVYGEVPHPTALAYTLLQTLPHVQLSASNDPKNHKESYSGVSLLDVLTRAGFEDSKPLSISVVLVSNDGSKKELSPAEIDAALHDALPAIIADRKNGKPLTAQDGPLLFILHQDKTSPVVVQNLARIQIKNLN